MKNLTLKDLSKILNLSPSTVSKALNNSPEISELTKKRVKEVALKYKYRPNSLGLSLKKGRTKTIGVIIPSVLDRFSAKLFIGIEKVAHIHGYNAILCTSNYSSERESENVDFLSDKGIDGIIISLTDETIGVGQYDHIVKAVNSGMEVVLANKVPEELRVHKVSIDFYEEAYNSIKNIGISNTDKVLVVDSFSDAIYLDRRKKGILDALENEHQYKDVELMKSNGEESFVKEVVANIKSKKISKLIISNQYLLETIINDMEIRKHLGTDQLLIYGYSNQKSTFENIKGVSAISQRGKFLGEKSAELLISQLEKKELDTMQTMRIDSIEKKIY
ncbi:LacI family DNA-binding transcriptional regulator [Sediminicola sp. 1XM1-17]|uniref:LacI family DNA-binding transcriptional regulator n=1 Tax=Sediminicola sp. 1XM1-17 TaxID=3127702 RepID=UPI0030779E22